MSLMELNKRIRECSRCPLRESADQPVCGTGNPKAKYMIVGEAPGREENLAGVPFVGRSGKRLNKLLAISGIDLGDVYMTNVCKCVGGGTLVYLPDGSSRRMSELVVSKYSGLVKTPYGAKKVVGWHRSKLGSRRVYKIYYLPTKSNVGGKVGGIFTEDHLMLTGRGWIAVKDLVESDKVHTGTPSPSIDLEELIVGSLLGDSHLHHGSFTEGHSIKQREYAEWKMGHISKVFTTKSQERVSRTRGGKLFPNFSFRTLSYPYIRMLRAKWYPEGKKIVPRDLK